MHSNLESGVMFPYRFRVVPRRARSSHASEPLALQPTDSDSAASVNAAVIGLTRELKTQSHSIFDGGNALSVKLVDIQRALPAKRTMATGLESSQMLETT